MRFYPKDLPKLLQLASSDAIKGVLFYGPDKGMIAHFTQEIKQNMQLAMRKVDYSNKLDLTQVFNTLNLFQEKEIIVLQNCGTSIENKNLFAGKLHNFAIFIADELSPSSWLRQLFEKDAALAAVACFSDSPNQLSAIIASYCRAKGKELERDALSYLCQNINNDRSFLYSELDKLCLYANEERLISLQTATKVILPLRSASLDKLCIALTLQNAEQYFSELANLFANNTAPILVIRSLIRYYVNITIAHQQLKAGCSMDDALKAIRPPVFFLYVDAFKQAVLSTTEAKIMQMLALLNNCEIELKSSYCLAQLAFENIFYQQRETL